MGDGEKLIDFEAWCDVSARMTRRDAAGRAAVLKEKGLDPELWTRSEEHYNRMIVEDVESGRHDRREAYGRRCADELARRKAPAPPAAPVVNRAPAHLVSTAPTRMAEIVRQVLPFGDKPSLDPTPQRSPLTPAMGSGSTAPVLDADLVARVKQSFPFGKPAGAPPSSSPAQAPPSSGAPPARTPEKAAAAPKFPLQTYASLCAELALHPANRAAILSRYGIGSDAEHRAIDEEWRAPLLEPEQRQKWQEYYNTYSEWLRKQAR